MTIAEARKFIPTSFRIGGNTIFVEIVECGENFGNFDSIRNRIQINLSINDANGIKVTFTEEQVKNTYWHELFHAFNFFYDNETTEVFAQTFANMMCEYEETKSLEHV